MVVLLKVSPISTQDFWFYLWTIGFLVTYLTKALFSLAGRPALGRVLVVPNFFHLRIISFKHHRLTEILMDCTVAVQTTIPVHCNSKSRNISLLSRTAGQVFSITFMGLEWPPFWISGSNQPTWDTPFTSQSWQYCSKKIFVSCCVFLVIQPKVWKCSGSLRPALLHRFSTGHFLFVCECKEGLIS